MDSRLQHLKEAIHIRNEFNRIAFSIVEQIKEGSKPFIGKKINTQKGLSDKYRDVVKFDINAMEAIKVNPVPGTKWARVHLAFASISYDDLVVKVSICFAKNPTGCVYEERNFYIGKVENSVLVSINDECNVDQTVLDYETELAKIKKFRELEAEAEKAKQEILVNSDAYQYLTIGYGL